MLPPCLAPSFSLKAFKAFSFPKSQLTLFQSFLPSFIVIFIWVATIDRWLALLAGHGRTYIFDSVSYFWSVGLSTTWKIKTHLKGGREERRVREERKSRERIETEREGWRGVLREKNREGCYASGSYATLWSNWYIGLDCCLNNTLAFGILIIVNILLTYITAFDTEPWITVNSGERESRVILFDVSHCSYFTRG